jgi:hypothetical protein
MKIQEFDYSVNILESILWQYNEAENLLGLLNQKQEWLNIYQTEFWQNWFNDVFALAYANITLFGCAVWAIILGVPLRVPIHEDNLNRPVWGFNAFDPSFPDLENTYSNFFYSNFANAHNGSYALTLAEQIFLLRLRYFQLTTRGDIIDINYFMDYLCRTSPGLDYSGTIYCLETYRMHMVYIFTDIFPANLLQAIRYEGLDLLPRPATVGEKIFMNPGAITWGFNAYDPVFPKLENTNVNFNNGNFFNGVLKT